MAIREVWKNRIRSFEIISDDTGEVIHESFGDRFAAEDIARRLGQSRGEAAAYGSAPAADPGPRARQEALDCIGRGVRVSRDRDESLPGSSGVITQSTIRSEPEFVTDQYGNVLDGSDDEYTPVELRVINCTPHPISIADESGAIIRTLEPSGTIPRVSSSLETREPIDGIPFSVTVFGEVTGLPEPEPGVFLVVSQFVLAACPDRLDLVRPDTGPDCVRDEKGRIVAVRRLTR